MFQLFCFALSLCQNLKAKSSVEGIFGRGSAQFLKVFGLLVAGDIFFSKKKETREYEVVKKV